MMGRSKKKLRKNIPGTKLNRKEYNRTLRKKLPYEGNI